MSKLLNWSGRLEMALLKLKIKYSMSDPSNFDIQTYLNKCLNTNYCDYNNKVY